MQGYHTTFMVRTWSRHMFGGCLLHAVNTACSRHILLCTYCMKLPQELVTRCYFLLVYLAFASTFCTFLFRNKETCMDWNDSSPYTYLCTISLLTWYCIKDYKMIKAWVDRDSLYIKMHACYAYLCRMESLYEHMYRHTYVCILM